MKSIAIIIDFDNFFGTDYSKISSENLEFSFSEIVNICQERFSEFDHIEFRLYGGWYKETSLTIHASILIQLLSNVNIFPKVKNQKVLNGSIKLISSLYLIPEHTFSHTYKETNGIKRIRLDFEHVDEICTNNRDLCPKYILEKFTKHKDKNCSVPGCNNIHKNVFKGIEQKMVDTLIACDIISISEEENIIGMLIISDDQDHFPSLALANKKHELNREKHLEAIILGIKNNYKFNFISEYLLPFNIETILLS